MGCCPSRFLTEVGKEIARTNKKATKIINLEAGTTTPLPLHKASINQKAKLLINSLKNE
jgi:hypothetical protein